MPPSQVAHNTSPHGKHLPWSLLPAHRLHRPVEWSLLLAMGHGVCQNPYTHHRVRVGASAHHLGLLLLWSAHPGVCFSCWCVVLRQEHQRREGVLWVSHSVVGVGFILCVHCVCSVSVKYCVKNINDARVFCISFCRLVSVSVCAVFLCVLLWLYYLIECVFVFSVLRDTLWWT